MAGRLAAARRYGRQGGGSQIRPRPVQRSHIGLERHFEDWIANDSALIEEGLTIVGHRISIGDGRLDLLAIDSMDRGLVVEIKPGILGTGALTQALAYASAIARLDAERISEKLDSNLTELGDKDKLSAAVKRQLDSEQETGGSGRSRCCSSGWASPRGWSE